ncbi:hypothetical protein C8R44DRAFT_706053, partial [Mycena epipterygia]
MSISNFITTACTKQQLCALLLLIWPMHTTIFSSLLAHDNDTTRFRYCFSCSLV